MNFQPAKCPNCGGQLQLPDDAEKVKCMYCTSDVIVIEAINAYKNEINLDNIFALAEAAESSKNYKEAYDYYTKILEFNPTSFKAWYGKAIAAGWQSTLANLRLAEVISGINKSLEYAPDSEKKSISDRAAKELNELAVTFSGMAIKNFKLCITLSTYNEFISRMKLVISAYQQAIHLKPDDPIMHENIIFSAQQYMLRYDCLGGREKVFPTESTYAEAKQIILEAEAQVKKYKPDYRASIPAHETGGGCYIATAVYGDYDAKEVLILRRFRDKVLLNSKIGIIFVKYYYIISPKLARRLQQHRAINNTIRKMLDLLTKYLSPRLAHYPGSKED